jgi:hypothetical protein
MKVLLAVTFLALTSGSWGQDDLLMQDAITKPAMSLRCKELFKERSAKINVQQRLNSLLQRNQDMIKKSPNARESFHKTLQANQIKIKNELHLINLQLSSMDENIVRSGCPGLTL